MGLRRIHPHHEGWAIGYRTHFNGWQAIHYSAADRLPGMPGHSESDIDGDTLSTWIEYALGTDPTVPNTIATTLGSIGADASLGLGLVVTRRRFTSDVQWDLLISPTLTGFSPLPLSVETNRTALSPEHESVLIHDPDPVSSASEFFYRLRISPVPVAP